MKILNNLLLAYLQDQRNQRKLSSLREYIKGYIFIRMNIRKSKCKGINESSFYHVSIHLYFKDYWWFKAR